MQKRNIIALSLATSLGLATMLAIPSLAVAADCAAGMSDQVYAAYVRTAQLELNLHGYDAGTPNGTPSPKLESAVRDYQKDAKLPEDGCVSKGLVDHLEFVLPRVVKARSPRAESTVGEVQKLLMQRGYYMGMVDGMNGSQTRDAIRRFEKDANLPLTGKADDSLIAKIQAADPSIRGDKTAP